MFFSFDVERSMFDVRRSSLKTAPYGINITCEPLQKMIIRLDAFENQGEVITMAKAILLRGGLVACPTESFYGLAVDATNKAAIRKLFSLKKRPANLPVLILIPSIESLTKYVTYIPPVARKLTREFWPGGLTLIFEASEHVSPLLTANTGKIGIRLSNHPVATALAQAIQAPVTGTSANISGAPPCHHAEEVLSYFGENIDLIIDGGETAGAIGSTILDVTVDPPEIVRDGMVQRRSLEKFIQTLSESSEAVPPKPENAEQNTENMQNGP